jgi:DNA polymerase III alpha subunit (gram-positive type)
MSDLHNIIVLDIETSGVDNNAAIIQIAYNIYNTENNCLSKHNHYLNDGSQRLDFYKRITLDTIINIGQIPELVLNQLLKDINENTCTHIIGHNIDFDIRHINRYMKKYNIINCEIFNNLKKIDTMKLSKTFVDARDKNNRLKYPRLEELYFKLFNKPIDNNNAHCADYDIQITFECYKEFNVLNL